METTLREIRDREDYLVKLKSNEAINACYHSGRGLYGGGQSILFTLNTEEKEFLKMVCISEIKRLRKSIECLTE